MICQDNIEGSRARGDLGACISMYILCCLTLDAGDLLAAGRH